MGTKITRSMNIPQGGVSTQLMVFRVYKAEMSMQSASMPDA